MTTDRTISYNSHAFVLFFYHDIRQTDVSYLLACLDPPAQPRHHPHQSSHASVTVLISSAQRQHHFPMPLQHPSCHLPLISHHHSHTHSAP
ncbi:hypothetical protein BKA81DRAFT_345802 [Phyllosticta paracitricarpa]